MWQRIPNFVKAFGPIGGIVAYARLYLARRAPGSLFALRRRGRTIWLRQSPSDISIFFQVMVKREYETRGWAAQHERLDRAYRALLAQGRTPVIVDAGANIGLASLWFADRYPAARIYAVEPDAANFAVLERNVAGHRGIIPLAGAVWDQPTRLRIGNPDAGAGALRVVEGDGDVRAYAISELVELPFDADAALFIVKIDIEGGEATLFRSHTGWAADAQLIVIETHDWLYPGEGTSRNFLRRIAELPVDFVFQGENVFCFRTSGAAS